MVQSRSEWAKLAAEGSHITEETITEKKELSASIHKTEEMDRENYRAGRHNAQSQLEKHLP